MPPYSIDTTKKKEPERGDVASASRNPALAAALREMEEKEQRGPWRQRAMIAASALLIVLVIAGATWAIKAKRAANEKAALIASVQQNPRQAWQLVQSGKLSQDDMDKAFESRRKEFEERENKQMDGYFALKTVAERNKYLDKVIDDQIAEREKRRKEYEARAATRPTSRPTSRPTTGPTTGPWGGAGGRGGDQAARARNRMEGGDPVRKAQRAAYQQAMHERMAARGIQPGRGMGGMGGGRAGGGGGGGGGGRPGGGGGGGGGGRGG